MLEHKYYIKTCLAFPGAMNAVNFGICIKTGAQVNVKVYKSRGYVLFDSVEECMSYVEATIVNLLMQPVNVSWNKNKLGDFYLSLRNIDESDTDNVIEEENIIDLGNFNNSVITIDKVLNFDCSLWDKLHSEKVRDRFIVLDSHSKVLKGSNI